jgi:quercetin dioxygenase-like cupin family protein
MNITKRQEVTMVEVIAGALDASRWIATGVAGIEYAMLREAEGGATIFVRMAKGTHGGEHVHPAGEELYVIAGDVTVGDKRLKAGAYLYTPPGASHAIDAHADSLLFVSLPKRVVFL